MRSRNILVLALLLNSALVSCSRKESTATAPMNAEQIIRQWRNSPVGDSIGPITRALAAQSVFVPTEGVTPTQEGKITGKMRFKIGSDKEGRLWVYVYTSRAEFSKSFPAGGTFVEMSFLDIFKIVETDQQFAGIYLNSASDARFPIPRVLFDHVRRALPRSSDG